MKLSSLLAFAFVGLLACSRKDSNEAEADSASQASAHRTPVSTENAVDPTLWLTNAPGHVASVDSATSRLKLVERFGAANVVDDSIQYADAPPVFGTVLFPKDSTRRLEIIWTDPKTQSHPERVFLRGESGRWAADPGIRLGMRLTELERVNGKPFTLTGFDWDYGGTVSDWKGGTLARRSSELPHLFVQLSPAEADTGAVRDSVAGDREFSSHDPRMQQLNPHVQVISVAYALPKK
jgi:hypothetical protein